MSTIRICCVDGVKRATVLERAGDWAITKRDGHVRTLSHVPTGVCVPDVERLPDDDLRSLMDRLSVLPSGDLQTIPLGEIKKLVKEAVRK